MKIAVISDIHANLEALEAVLEHIDNQKVDQIVCLGDIVDYGPNPKECLGIMKERVVETDVREKRAHSTRVQSRYLKPIIRGNHDELIMYNERIARLKKHEDREIALWTQAQLGSAEIEWMKTFPYNLMIPPQQGADGRLILLTHGEWTWPEKFRYLHVNEHDELTSNNLIEMHRGDMMFCGHTHKQAIHRHLKWERPPLNTTTEYTLDLEDKVIVNAGSAGTPRLRGDNKATYVIYDRGRDVITFNQVAYDYERTITKIASLPISETTKKSNHFTPPL